MKIVTIYWRWRWWIRCPDNRLRDKAGSKVGSIHHRTYLINAFIDIKFDRILHRAVWRKKNDQKRDKTSREQDVFNGTLTFLVAHFVLRSL